MTVTHLLIADTQRLCQLLPLLNLKLYIEGFTPEEPINKVGNL
jgi:hypothetical protein